MKVFRRYITPSLAVRTFLEYMHSTKYINARHSVVKGCCTTIHLPRPNIQEFDDCFLWDKKQLIDFCKYTSKYYTVTPIKVDFALFKVEIVL